MPLHVDRDNRSFDREIFIAWSMVPCKIFSILVIASAAGPQSLVWPNVSRPMPTLPLVLRPAYIQRCLRLSTPLVRQPNRTRIIAAWFYRLHMVRHVEGISG